MGIFDFFSKNKAPKIAGYKTLKVIEKKYDNHGGFSFEYSDSEVSIVKDRKGMKFLRVYKKECTSEGNGRPVTTVSDDLYPITDSEDVTAQNWKKVMISHYSDGISLKHESYSGV